MNNEQDKYESIVNRHEPSNNNEQQKKFWEKINYTSILLVDIMKIGQNQDYGGTGEEQLEKLKADLLPEIQSDVAEDINKCVLQYSKVLNALQGRYTFVLPERPLQSLSALSGIKLFTNSDEIIGRTQKQAEFIKDVPPEDLNYLYYKFKPGALIDTHHFENWLRLRCVYSQQKIIIKCAHERHNLLLTSDRAVETGHL